MTRLEIDSESLLEDYDRLTERLEEDRLTAERLGLEDSLSGLFQLADSAGDRFVRSHNELLVRLGGIEALLSGTTSTTKRKL